MRIQQSYIIMDTEEQVGRVLGEQPKKPWLCSARRLGTEGMEARSNSNDSHSVIPDVTYRL